MNVLDILLVVLLLAAAVSGFRRGALLQILTYAGLLLGLFLGTVLAPALAGLSSDLVIQAGIVLATLLAGAALGDAAGWFVGARLGAAARRSWLGPVDTAAGSVVAVVALLLATWFLSLNLAHGPFPRLAREIQGSAIVRALDRVLPEPPSLVGQARRFLDRFGFPEVFAGLPPAASGPVRVPGGADARAATRAASRSTVRIVGEACGRIQEGTGFVVASTHVLTNAHVVAGVDAPRVEAPDGSRQAALPVLFDPRTDVAVLRVAEAPGPVLPLAEEDARRGTGGAVLGYPGGGTLASSPTAVRRVLEALGRDIYGRGTVVREVYELQAVVRPGNSGGPFVLPDGEVAGVVFAASSTDPGVAYALTSDEVADEVTEALARTEAMSTGPCVR